MPGRPFTLILSLSTEALSSSWERTQVYATFTCPPALTPPLEPIT